MGAGSSSTKPHSPLSSSVAPSAALGFKAIGDSFESLEDVTAALRRAGLESSQLIVAVDFTKSNEWNGKRTYGGRCLHDAAAGQMNPYETVISAIGRTLADFDDDHLIPAYGFGDITTHDNSCFSFLPFDQPCAGLEQVLSAYRALLPHLKLSGPTSFGPVVRKAVDTVVASGMAYHILVIVADGEVTRPSGLPAGELSEQEQDTVDAIVEASNYPLSIVCVGVGDGPWHQMREFDDRLPSRRFDNFQFVELNRVSSIASAAARDTEFARQALMEVPEQYNLLQRLKLKRSPRPSRGAAAWRDPPADVSAFLVAEPVLAYAEPAAAAAAAYAYPEGAYGEEYSYEEPSAPPMMAVEPARPAAVERRESLRLQAELDAMREATLCVVCMEKAKNTVFQCGHQTCDSCAAVLENCPICRTPIETRIKLYS
eukprot:PLAT13238.1.p1 GENE.PLAT13238.1~~PLAT13238.1.p1  ORF type:complete len:428 (-),score=88.09 PLAT13238.1:24-1307(-)